MYQLFVSRNCGATYCPERSVETLIELQSRMDELDEMWLRWYVEQDGEPIPDVVCERHKRIIVFMQTVAKHPLVDIVDLELPLDTHTIL